MLEEEAKEDEEPSEEVGVKREEECFVVEDSAFGKRNNIILFQTQKRHMTNKPGINST